MERITLKTLPQSTAQQVFDHVAIHLLFQNERSEASPEYVVSDTLCYYRNGKLACAAGCLIADDEYDFSFEQHTWRMLVNDKLVPSAHQDLIEQLQNIHDHEPVHSWRKSLQELAKECSLEFDESKIDAAVVAKMAALTKEKS